MKSLILIVIVSLYSYASIESVEALDKRITWSYSLQTVTVYADEKLTIDWTGSHDVWMDSVDRCTGGGTQKTPEAEGGEWTALAGTIPVGTHYFSCRVGQHCQNNMKLTVTSVAGSNTTAGNAPGPVPSPSPDPVPSPGPQPSPQPSPGQMNATSPTPQSLAQTAWKTSSSIVLFASVASALVSSLV